MRLPKNLERIWVSGQAALLNATMGNATELILSFFALRAGHAELVKASLSGSIIGNILLVLGMSVLAGGIGRERQTFSKRHASINSTMLFIAVVALVIPAVFGFAVFGHIEEHGARVEQLSLWTCVVLVILYALNLLFTFGGNKAHAEGEKPIGSPARAAIALVIATVLVGWLSEILVGEIESSQTDAGDVRTFHGCDLHCDYRQCRGACHGHRNGQARQDGTRTVDRDWIEHPDRAASRAGVGVPVLDDGQADVAGLHATGNRRHRTRRHYGRHDCL